MIVVTAHRHREQGQEETLRPLRRKISLGFGKQTENILLIKPKVSPEPFRRRRADVDAMRRRNVASTSDTEFLRPMEDVRREALVFKQHTSRRSHAHRGDLGGLLVAGRPSVPDPLSPSEASSLESSSPLLFTPERRQGRRHRRMDDELEDVSFVLSPKQPPRMSPPTITTHMLSPESPESSSDLELSDVETKEFCRERRLNVLRARREQIQVVMEQVPASRAKYSIELVELDKTIEDEMKHSPPPPKNIATLSPPASLEPQPTVEDTEIESSPPSPPPPILSTFDWSFFSRAYIHRLLDFSCPLANVLLLPGDFEKLELELARLEQHYDRRAVFDKLVALWREQQEKQIRFPSFSDMYVDELCVALNPLRDQFFPNLTEMEVRDYVNRMVLQCLPRVNSGEELFRTEDFNAVEHELRDCSRTFRQALFDAMNSTMENLFPGLATNFVPPPNPTLKQFVRFQRRPNPECFAHEVANAMLKLNECTHAGAAVDVAQTTMISQDLARNVFALEEDEWTTEVGGA